ncbi:MAG: sigma 54-interacting transcriptional regulator, partial [Bacteroidota bacterium]
ALQEREITRIGGNETTKIDTRIIVATHKNLLEEVKKGSFREDLYYRLLGLPIQLPPLRTRENDILLLAKHFVDEFCKENKLPAKIISPTVQGKLLSYSFPGNVRELKAVMELAVVMSEKDYLEEEDITFHGNTTFEDFLSREDTLKNYEMRIINHYLDKYDNDVLLVAKKLDIGKSTIYRYLKNGHLKVN